MTPEAQRIAIAKACPPNVVILYDGFPVWRDQWEYGESSGTRSRVEFDPLNDLNAMHEAEKVLPADDSAEGHWGYIGHLIEVVKADSMEIHREVFILAHATAAQRAESFLKTLNLWVEDKQP